MADEVRGPRTQVRVIKGSFPLSRGQKAAKPGNPLGARKKPVPDEPQRRQGLDPDDRRFGRYIIPPPFDLRNLTSLPRESSILRQCIEALATNVDSYGWDLEYIGPKGKEDSAEAKAEAKRVRTFLLTCNIRESFVGLRLKLRWDLESTGTAYWEITRNMKGDPVGIDHLPAHTMRLTPLDRYNVKQDVTLVGDDGDLVNRPVFQRYRRFVQLQDLRRVFFKELGDPRTIRALDGKVLEDPTSSTPEEEIVTLETPSDAGDTRLLRDVTLASGTATEVLYFNIYSPDSAYGEPRHLGNMPAILGSRFADEADLSFWERGAVDTTLILCSGGTLTPEAKADIQSFFEEQALGKDNAHRYLVIDGVPATASLDEKRSSMSLAVQPLRGAEVIGAAKDYDARNIEKVRSSFRLMPVYVGDVQGTNFASMQAGRVVTNEQVFEPLRTGFDEVINLRLLRPMGVRFWNFYSKGPEIADVGVYVAAVQGFNAVGAMTPNEGINLANELLGTTIEKINEPWADYPFPMVMEILRQGMLTGIEDLEKPQPAPSLHPGLEALISAGERAAPTGTHAQPGKTNVPTDGGNKKIPGPSSRELTGGSGAGQGLSQAEVGLRPPPNPGRAEASLLEKRDGDGPAEVLAQRVLKMQMGLARLLDAQFQRYLGDRQVKADMGVGDLAEGGGLTAPEQSKAGFHGRRRRRRMH